MYFPIFLSKDCGDVNAIGRVHAYLESIGAINVGFATKIRSVKRSSKRKLSDGSANSTDGSSGGSGGGDNRSGKRKTKTRVEDDEWSYPGSVIFDFE